ncbi:hypothetical protein [Schlesneria sp. T3-172]|uniref:hypothetical protein n=1 Tax=Schlesneria sphaerica TaxID=3373610 RepID=UPI0037CCAB1E
MRDVKSDSGGRPVSNPVNSVTARRNGIVLVVVMVVIVMVSLAGFGFVASISHENKVVHLRGEQMQMENALASAEEFLKLYLSLPPNPEATSDTDLVEQELMRGVVVSDEARPNSRVRFTAMAPHYDDGTGTKWQYGMLRESGKLDLRKVLQWETEMPGQGRQSLMTLPGMTEAIAEALLDWMDSDSMPRSAGAEGDYYSSLTPPYSARNGIPLSLEELLLVKGVTRSLLYGSDTNQNHRIDLDEQAAGLDPVQQDVSGGKHIPWVELLTLYSDERNSSSSGQPRVNLNQMDLSQLHRQLSSAVDPEFANFVVLYRQNGPGPAGGRPIELRSVRVDFRIPARFSILSLVDLIQTRVSVAVPGGVAGSVESTLSNEAEKLDESLGKVWDSVTVAPEPVLKGLININLAPAEVLQAIPGMEKDLADQIVTSRNSSTQKSPSHDLHPCWPFTEGLTDLARMRQLVPYITVGGDVYRTQLIAFSEASRLSQRVELVLDASRRPVRRKYWKDLQVLGRGYPWDVIDTPGGISNTQTGAFNATPFGN